MKNKYIVRSKVDKNRLIEGGFYGTGWNESTQKWIMPRSAGKKGEKVF